MHSINISETPCTESLRLGPKSFLSDGKSLEVPPSDSSLIIKSLTLESMSGTEAPDGSATSTVSGISSFRRGEPWSIKFPPQGHGLAENYFTSVANPSLLRMDAQPYIYSRSPNSSLMSTNSEEIYKPRSQRKMLKHFGAPVFKRLGSNFAETTPVSKLMSFRSLISSTSDHREDIREIEEVELSLPGVLAADHVWLESPSTSAVPSSGRMMRRDSSMLMMIKSIETCPIISFYSSCDHTT